MEIVIWGGFVRFGEAVLSGAPTLLVGLFVAGVFRKLIGPEVTFRVFGGTSWRSLPQAWLWGMLLPVCSIGVIPVAYEMRRAGLKGGAILAFALTAPLFNPLSLLYGLTLSSPIVILSFATGSLIVVTTVGILWDRLYPHSAIEEPIEPPVPPGLKRLAAVAVVAARHMAGPTLYYAALGLAGSIVLAALFPFGSLTDSMAHTDTWAPLKMLVLALPAYATPLNVISQVGGMFVHGNSVGAAYVLLSLGTGANLGLIGWAWNTYGFRRAFVFLVAFIGVVMVIAYAINEPLYSAGNVDHPHTHAFDVYACPFSPANSSGLPHLAWAKLSEDAQSYEITALLAIACLFACGMALRVWDPHHRVEQSLVNQAEHSALSNGSWLNANVPGPVLGVTAILGLITFSLVGCFVYYPAPNETIEDMRYVKVDVLSYASSKDVANAAKSIEVYDDLTRKLQVGYYLRHWRLSEYQQAKARVLRGRVEQLKDILEAGTFERTRPAIDAVQDAHRRLVKAFEAPGSTK